jgi:C4-type Zn-finger protein
MNILETITVQCPSCGEVMELQVDCAEGNQELTEECPVCDKPFTISVTISDNGVSSVEVLEE